MAKVKGYQVTVSGISAGSEQSCSLSIQNNLQEEEIKDAANPLSPPQEKVSATWQIQQTVVINSANSADNVAGLKALLRAALGTSASAVSMSAAGATFSGQAYPSDVSIQAPNRGIITCNATYQGTGAISKS